MEGPWALRLVQFNLHAARFAHESWLSGAECLSSIRLADRRGEFRGEPAVSDWLLAQVGARGELDWDMDEAAKRLWLLDPASLHRAARELALAMHRDWLVQIIQGERVRGLQQKVSKEALRFVIQDVPARGLHFSAPQVDFEGDSAAELGAKLESAGARALIGLLQPTWRAVRARAQLFFDRAASLADVPVFEGEHYTRALDLVLNQLVPRRLGEWAWLF